MRMVVMVVTEVHLKIRSEGLVALEDLEQELELVRYHLHL
jgi:hypothetical protein